MAVLILHAQLVCFDMKSLELCKTNQWDDFATVCAQEKHECVCECVVGEMLPLGRILFENS